MDLQLEQRDLLLKLVEATLSVPRPEQTFYLSCTDQGASISGCGMHESVLGRDVHDLEEAGYLRAESQFIGGDMEFIISPTGHAYYEEVLGKTKPLEAVEAETSRYFDETTFKSLHPEPHLKLSEARALLAAEDVQQHLTVIGHKIREALQHFTTDLVESHNVADVDSNPERVLNRLNAVFSQNKAQLGERRHDLLDSLVKYWNAVYGAVNRVEHGGQKNNEPVTVEDARQVIFISTVVMFEIDKTLKAATAASDPL